MKSIVIVILSSSTLLWADSRALDAYTKKIDDLEKDILSKEKILDEIQIPKQSEDTHDFNSFLKRNLTRFAFEKKLDSAGSIYSNLKYEVRMADPSFAQLSPSEYEKVAPRYIALTKKFIKQSSNFSTKFSQMNGLVPDYGPKIQYSAIEFGNYLKNLKLPGSCKLEIVKTDSNALTINLKNKYESIEYVLYFNQGEKAESVFNENGETITEFNDSKKTVTQGPSGQLLVKHNPNGEVDYFSMSARRPNEGLSKLLTGKKEKIDSIVCLSLPKTTKDAQEPNSVNNSSKNLLKERPSLEHPENMINHDSSVIAK